MNDKERHLEQLSAYLDGELAADEVLEVEKLLAEDEELRAELESLRQTRELLRLMPAESAPKHFAHDVMARAERHHHLGAEAPGGSWRLTRWVTLATAAVVLVSAGLALMIMSDLPEQPLSDTADDVAATSARKSETAVEGDDREIAIIWARRSDDGGTVNEITEAIWTDDLARTQQEVEEVLVSEGLEAEPPVEAQRRASRGMVRAQVFNVQQVQPTQVLVEVDVSLDRIEELKTALTRLRDQQRVVQGPGVFATGGETGEADDVKRREVASGSEDRPDRAEEEGATEIASSAPKPAISPQGVETGGTKADANETLDKRTEPGDRVAAAGGDAGPSVSYEDEEDDADEPIGKMRATGRFRQIPVQRVVITLNYRAAAPAKADIEAAMEAEKEPDFSSDDAPGD
jgi:hypothetical protein